MGQFTKAVTDAEFDKEVLKSSKPVLVDFWAEWCPPCKALAPTLEEIAEEMSTKLTVLKLDVDENQNAAAQYGIRSIPTMILFKDGKAIDQLMGKVPKATLVDFINKNT
jgi:thioredoxin 1